MTTMRKILVALAQCLGCVAGLLLVYWIGAHLYWSRVHPNIPLAQSIRLARDVNIDYIDNPKDRELARKQVEEGLWASVRAHRVAHVRRGESAHFPVFQASGDFQATPSRNIPDCTVTIFTTLGVYAEYHYSYVSTTGELGRNEDWCRVTPEFRKWVAEQIANPPSDDPAPGAAHPSHRPVTP